MEVSRLFSRRGTGNGIFKQAAKAAAAHFVIESRLAFMAQACRERHSKFLLVYTKTSYQAMYSNGQIPPTNITFIPAMPGLFHLKPDIPKKRK